MANGQKDTILQVGADVSAFERQVSQSISRLQAQANRLNIGGGQNLIQNNRTRSGRNNGLGKISGDAQEFESSFKAASSRVTSFGAVAAVIYSVDKAFSELIKTTFQVDKNLTAVNATLELSAKNLGAFKGNLFGIARNTGQSFEEVSKAAIELSRQGLGVEETLKRTNAALLLTRFTGLDAAKSVQGITAAINSFNKTIVDANELVSKFTALDAASAASAADFADAISKVGSTAQDAGVSIDELSALTATLVETTGRSGGALGNSLKTIFTRLERSRVKNVLKEELNIDSEGKNAIQVLSELAANFDKLSTSAQSSIVELSAGVFQSNVFRAALGDLGKETSRYTELLNKSKNAQDEAYKRNEKYKQSLTALANDTLLRVQEAFAAVGDLTINTPNVKNIFKGTGSILSGLTDALSQDDESKDLGGIVAQGIFKGIGDFATGPGAAILLSVFGALLVKVGQFSTKALRGVLNLDAQEKIAHSINDTLSKQPQLLNGILNGQVSIMDAEKQIYNYITSQNAALVKQLQIATSIAQVNNRLGVGADSSGSFALSVRSTKKKPTASGFMPDESTLIQMGAYGTPKNAQVRHGIVRGVGPVQYNTSEDLIRDFPVKGKDSVIPKDPKRAKETFRRFGYMASGYVPNFAKKKLIPDGFFEASFDYAPDGFQDKGNGKGRGFRKRKELRRTDPYWYLNSVQQNVPTGLFGDSFDIGNIGGRDILDSIGSYVGGKFRTFGSGIQDKFARGRNRIFGPQIPDEKKAEIQSVAKSLALIQSLAKLNFKSSNPEFIDSNFQAMSRHIDIFKGAYGSKYDKNLLEVLRKGGYKMGAGASPKSLFEVGKTPSYDAPLGNTFIGVKKLSPKTNSAFELSDLLSEGKRVLGISDDAERNSAFTAFNDKINGFKKKNSSKEVDLFEGLARLGFNVDVDNAGDKTRELISRLGSESTLELNRGEGFKKLSGAARKSFTKKRFGVPLAGGHLPYSYSSGNAQVDQLLFSEELPFKGLVAKTQSTKNSGNPLFKLSSTAQGLDYLSGLGSELQVLRYLDPSKIGSGITGLYKDYYGPKLGNKPFALQQRLPHGKSVLADSFAGGLDVNTSIRLTEYIEDYLGKNFGLKGVSDIGGNPGNVFGPSGLKTSDAVRQINQFRKGDYSGVKNFGILDLLYSKHGHGKQERPTLFSAAAGFLPAARYEGDDILTRLGYLAQQVFGANVKDVFNGSAFRADYGSKKALGVLGSPQFRSSVAGGTQAKKVPDAFKPTVERLFGKGATSNFGLDIPSRSSFEIEAAYGNFLDNANLAKLRGLEEPEGPSPETRPNYRSGINTSIKGGKGRAKSVRAYQKFVAESVLGGKGGKFTAGLKQSPFVSANLLDLQKGLPVSLAERNTGKGIGKIKIVPVGDGSFKISGLGQKFNGSYSYNQIADLVNAMSAGRVGSRKGYNVFAGGHIGDAIAREKASGVPASSIRIGHDPRIGLGVYNTVDEPHGLSQGIHRAISEGKNPKTYGVPNFAAPRRPDGYGRRIPNAPLQDLSIPTEELNTRIFRNLLRSLDLLGQLPPSAFNSLNLKKKEVLGKLIDNVQENMSPEGVFLNKRRILGNDAKSGDAAIEDFRRGLLTAPRYQGRSAYEVNRTVGSAPSAQYNRSLNNPETFAVRGGLQARIRARDAMNDSEYLQSMGVSGSTAGSSKRNAAAFIGVRDASAVPNRNVGNAYKQAVLKDQTDYLKKDREDKANRLRVERENNAAAKNSKKGFLRGIDPLTLAFLAPIAGETVGGFFGNQSKGQQVSSSVGNIASFASTGALLGSAIPGLGTGAGAAIGAVIGGFKELDPLLKAFTSNLPQLTKAVEAATTAYNAIADGGRNYLINTERLADLEKSGVASQKELIDAKIALAKSLGALDAGTKKELESATTLAEKRKVLERAEEKAGKVKSTAEFSESLASLTESKDRNILSRGGSYAVNFTNEIFKSFRNNDIGTATEDALSSIFGGYTKTGPRARDAARTKTAAEESLYAGPDGEAVLKAQLNELITSTGLGKSLADPKNADIRNKLVGDLSDPLSQRGTQSLDKLIKGVTGKTPQFTVGSDRVAFATALKDFLKNLGAVEKDRANNKPIVTRYDIEKVLAEKLDKLSATLDVNISTLENQTKTNSIMTDALQSFGINSLPSNNISLERESVRIQAQADKLRLKGEEDVLRARVKAQSDIVKVSGDDSIEETNKLRDLEDDLSRFLKIVAPSRNKIIDQNVGTANASLTLKDALADVFKVDQRASIEASRNLAGIAQSLRDNARNISANNFTSKFGRAPNKFEENQIKFGNPFLTDQEAAKKDAQEQSALLQFERQILLLDFENAKVQKQLLDLQMRGILNPNGTLNKDNDTAKAFAQKFVSDNQADYDKIYVDTEQIGPLPEKDDFTKDAVENYKKAGKEGASINALSEFPGLKKLSDVVSKVSGGQYDLQKTVQNATQNAASNLQDKAFDALTQKVDEYEKARADAVKKNQDDSTDKLFLSKGGLMSLLGSEVGQSSITGLNGIPSFGGGGDAKQLVDYTQELSLLLSQMNDAALQRVKLQAGIDTTNNPLAKGEFQTQLRNLDQGLETVTPAFDELVKTQTANYEATLKYIDANKDLFKSYEDLKNVLEIQDLTKALATAIASGASGETQRNILGQRGQKRLDSGDIGGIGDNVQATTLFDYTDQIKALSDITTNFIQSFENNLTDAFVNIINGTASVEDAFKQMGIAILQEVQREATSALIKSSVGSVSGLLQGFAGAQTAAKGGAIRGYATGGVVTGGSGVKDDVPAMLSGGEYVIRKSSVNKYGEGLMHAINGGKVGKYADGGFATSFNYNSVFDNYKGTNPQDLFGKGVSEYAITQTAIGQNALSEINARAEAFEQYGKELKEFNSKYSANNLAFSLGSVAASIGISGAGGSFKKKATGGPAQDNIPALLMGGEYVMNRDAVSKYGPALMSSINRGTFDLNNVKGYADGGLVGGSGSNGFKASTGSNVKNTNNVGITINIGADGSVNSNVAGADQSDVTAKDAQDQADASRMLGKQIEQAVVQVLEKQSRPNGLLANRFVIRR